MADLIVNLVLVAAMLVLVAVWTVTTARGRRHDRRQRAEHRALILQAFTGTGDGPPAQALAPALSDLSPSAPPAGPQDLDAASVSALIDLLEDRQRRRPGLISGLVMSPRAIWSAGEQVGRRTLGKQAATGAGLYRDAAAEIVDVYAHDPKGARQNYVRYASALGEAALAELYVRSAAHSACVGPDDVQQIVQVIAGIVPVPSMSTGAITDS